MEQPTSTQSSTAGTDSFVATLPPPYREALQGYIDELQRYRDSPAHARQSRTERLDSVIEQCYRDHQAPLERSFSLRNRTEELRKKLDSALKRPNCQLDLTCVPCRKKLKQVVYRLAPELSK